MKTFTALASAFLLPAAIATATANNEQQAMENYVNAWLVKKCELMLDKIEGNLSMQDYLQRDALATASIPIDELPPRFQDFIRAKNALDLSLARVITLTPQPDDALLNGFTNMHGDAMMQLENLYQKEDQAMEALIEVKMKALIAKLPARNKGGVEPTEEQIAEMKESFQSLIAESKSNIKALPKADNSKEQARQKSIARLLYSFQIYQLERLINCIQEGKNSNTLQPVSMHQLVQEGKLPIAGIGEKLTAFLKSDPSKPDNTEKHASAVAELTFHNTVSMVESISASAKDLEILSVPIAAIDPAKPETKSKYLPILQHALQGEKARLAELGK